MLQIVTTVEFYWNITDNCSGVGTDYGVDITTDPRWILNCFKDSGQIQMERGEQ